MAELPTIDAPCFLCGAGEAVSVWSTPDRAFAVPGRYAVAIAVAGALPFIFAMAQQPISSMLGLVVLTIVPSLLSKLVFAAPRPWSIVLLINAVYALTALAVYGLVARKVRRS